MTDSRTRPALVAAAVLAGVLVPGVAAHLLANRLDRPVAATLTWVVGYAAVVVVAWFYYVRPLDLRGPVE